MKKVKTPLQNHVEIDRIIDTAGELKKIQDIIKQKKVKWEAGDTSISRLDPKRRAELLSPTPFGPVLPAKPLPTPFPPIPTFFDWTNVDGSNYLTSVKQQFGGTCTAFASAAVLESCVLRAGLAHDIDLSEHAICACPDGGCGNLHAIAAFMKSRGLPPEDWFTGELNTARPGWNAETYKVESWDCFYPTTVNEVKALIVQHGPVVTTMNCPEEFFYYSGGIYSNTGHPSLGFHAVVVVGYDDRGQYFKAKNSWGQDWGEDRWGQRNTNAENGYFRIAYSEFKSAIVNFGWDIHTYSGATGPNMAALMITSSKNVDGRQEVFSIGTDHKLYHAWQTAPNGDWTPSYALDPGSWAKDLVVERNADGRLEVVYVGSDDKLYHIWQTTPNGGWSPSYVLDNGSWSKQFSVKRNADGRMEVIYIGSDNKLYHIWQTAPNSGWSPSYVLDNGSWAKQLTVKRNADGRLEVVYIGLDDRLYHIWQTAPNSGWSPSYLLDGGGWAKQLVIGSNADGRLDVFYIGINDKIYHIEQAEPNGDWHNEVRL